MGVTRGTPVEGSSRRDGVRELLGLRASRYTAQALSVRREPCDPARQSWVSGWVSWCGRSGLHRVRAEQRPVRGLVQEAERRCRKLRDGAGRARAGWVTELQVIFRKNRLTNGCEMGRESKTNAGFCLNSRKKRSCLQPRKGRFWVESG